LVSVCAVDSELGVIQPTEEIADVVSSYPSCRFHTDAAQAVGKLLKVAGVTHARGEKPRADPENGAVAKFSLNGVSCLSFAAHKFYGLTGAAFLVRHKKTVLTPLVHGGSGGALYRGGTPSLPFAASARCAVELAYADAEARYAKVLYLNNFLREELVKIKKIRVNSPVDASPYILNISVDGMKGEDAKDALSEREICVSVKSACSVKNMPSKAVYAVTGDKKRALSSFRISLSHLTEKAEAEEFLAAIASISKEI
jgi:cysteine desulfurase